MAIIKNKIGKLNNITKILLIILVVSVSYFIIFLVLKPFLITQPTSMAEMMREVMTGSGRTDIKLISFIISLIIGVIISFYLFKQEQKEETKVKEYDIIKKVLSGDENKILNEIKKTKEITQDSLRFRLNWSKAKISTILTNLDRKGIIQRERTGKTYKVYLQKV